MSSSIRRPILIGVLAICLCLAYAAGLGVYQLWANSSEEHASQSRPLGVFWEAWDHTEEHFYGQLPSPRDRTYGAIRAVLSLLNDPYTIFVEPQPRELERDQMSGAFGGIGVTLWRDAEGRMILSPYSGSPAEQAAVREGDILLAVDGEEITAETSVDDVRAHFHGEIGTSVTLTISRPPSPPFDVTIIRDEIQVPSVIWRVLDQAPGVGYVRIERFTARTGDEITGALQDLLQGAAISSLILDLRDNAGGLIAPAVATASQFLHVDDGIVLTELYRDARTRSFPIQEGGIATAVPLMVLINRGTASASEIVAGALQDHSRASLIGEPTFGKGSVQLIYDLSDGSSLHVTTAVWLTPNNHQIEGQGLTPDIYVPRGDGAQDKQLDRAIAHLQSGQ